MTSSASLRWLGFLVQANDPDRAMSLEALRWYLAMLNTGNGDGIHEAQGLAPQMTVAQILEAGRLAGRPAEAEVLTTWRRNS